MTGLDLFVRSGARWALQYPALRTEAGACVFPCDERGNVPLDELGRRALFDYLFARCMVGLVFAQPRVIPAAQH